MSFTQQDLDAVNAALASGVLKVQSSSGETMEYRSVAELRTAKRLIESELAQATGTPRHRAVVSRYKSGL